MEDEIEVDEIHYDDFVDLLHVEPDIDELMVPEYEENNHILSAIEASTPFHFALRTQVHPYAFTKTASKLILGRHPSPS